MKNEKFKEKVSERGVSIYHLSKETGIPYTTLNELFNGKTDINKCGSETVYKLSLCFNCSVEELINPIKDK